MFQVVTASEGDTVNVSCGAIGNPEPFISWRKNWGHIPSPPRVTATSDRGVGILTIREVSYDGWFATERSTLVSLVNNASKRTSFCRSSECLRFTNHYRFRTGRILPQVTLDMSSLYLSQ